MIPFLKEAVSGLFSKPSTEGYPFTPKEAPEGYRGRIVFHADRCIGCGMCAAAGASHDRCVQAHIYGMTEAERFGGKYIYFCPMGLCLLYTSPSPRDA